MVEAKRGEGGEGEERKKRIAAEIEKSSRAECLVRAPNVPKTTVRVKRKREAAALVHRKDLNGIGPIPISVRGTGMRVSWKSFQGASSFGISLGHLL